MYPTSTLSAARMLAPQVAFPPTGRSATLEASAEASGQQMSCGLLSVFKNGYHSNYKADRTA